MGKRRERELRPPMLWQDELWESPIGTIQARKPLTVLKPLTDILIQSNTNTLGTKLTLAVKAVRFIFSRRLDASGDGSKACPGYHGQRGREEQSDDSTSNYNHSSSQPQKQGNLGGNASSESTRLSCQQLPQLAGLPELLEQSFSSFLLQSSCPNTPCRLALPAAATWGAPHRNALGMRAARGQRHHVVHSVLFCMKGNSGSTQKWE